MNFDFPDYYRLTPLEMLEARLGQVRQLLGALSLDGLLITGNVDLFYLSGTMQQGGLFVAPDGYCKLYCRRHAGRAAAESPLDVMAVQGFSQMAQDFISHLPQGARLGVCPDVMSAREYLSWQKRLPGVELVDFSPALQRIKGIKDAFELDALKRAGGLAQVCYTQLPRILRPGISEAQAAGELEALIMAGGGMDLVRTRAGFLEGYTWHLVSGPRSSWPSVMDAPFGGVGPSPAFPHGAGLNPLLPGQAIIVDVAVMMDGYIVDLTRTYTLGPAPAWLQEAHACLEAVEAAIVERLKPGAVSGDFYELSLDIAGQRGFSSGFLGRADQRIGFVGHGVGLELGAWPYLVRGSQETVQAHEVYALELKLITDEGPVGLENTFVVEPDGPPTLLTPLPGKVIEIPI